MTFTELCDEVYSLTHRPDLVAVTESAVKSATLLAHHSDFYFKDIEEIGIAFDESLREQQLEYRLVAPKFRAFKYLRKYDFAAQSPGDMLTNLLPEQLFDRYGLAKTDVCYVAGAYINIRSSTLQQHYIFGYYKNPTILTPDFNSWIAADHPYAIVFSAAGTVFKTIGKDDEAAAYREMKREQIILLQHSNVQADGY